MERKNKKGIRKKAKQDKHERKHGRGLSLSSRLLFFSLYGRVNETRSDTFAWLYVVIVFEREPE